LRRSGSTESGVIGNVSALTRFQSKKAAQIQDSIRQVLFRDWDPIGVNDNPNLADEYDNYLAPVYRILTGSRSEEELVQFFFRTESETIGLSTDSTERLRPMARKLLELDVKL